LEADLLEIGAAIQSFFFDFIAGFENKEINKVTSLHKLAVIEVSL